MKYRDSNYPLFTNSLFGKNPPLFQVSNVFSNPADALVPTTFANNFFGQNSALANALLLRNDVGTIVAVDVPDCAIFQTGKFVFSSKWNLKNDSSLTSFEVSKTFQKFFLPKVRKLTGYEHSSVVKSFGGSLYVNVRFLTYKSALVVGDMIRKFVAETPLKNEIDFDYYVVGKVASTMPPGRVAV